MLFRLNLSQIVLGIGLLGLASLMGCSPSEDAATPDSEAAVEEEAFNALDSIEALTDEAGSEPKESAAADEGVDTSIRDAGEFGDDAMVQGLTPEGWSQTGNIEHYNVATLYTKINGRSELYMAYDVLGMTWISFVDDSDSGNFVDLFIYDMRSPTNAFGIYSVEREADQPAVDLGREGYQTGSNLYFWKGNYYGYVNASKPNDRNSTAGLSAAAGLMKRLSDSGAAVIGLDLLPARDLINDTVQYFKADAMSLDFLNETFLGMYNIGDSKVRAFVSNRADEAEAANIMTEFGVYGDDYADGVEKVEIDGIQVTLTDWGGDFYDTAFHIGPLVAGLSNVEGRDYTTTATAELIARLKE